MADNYTGTDWQYRTKISTEVMKSLDEGMLQAAEKSDAAAASAAAAAESAADAESGVQEAVTKATEAAESANEAAEKAEKAATDASDAAESASSAMEKAEEAEKSITEAVTQATEAVEAANTAVTQANEATTTANEAVTKAETAASNATEAAEKANEAAGSANEAATAANEAAEKAQEATEGANEAIEKAEAANEKADSAVEAAQSAIETAQGVSDKVDESLADIEKAAENASQSATAANEAANTASSAASSANDSAEAAEEAATDAESAAQEAKDAWADAVHSVTVGETTTGEPGTNASVTNSGTNQDLILDFTIPKSEVVCYYGTCNTQNSTAAKAVVVDGDVPLTPGVLLVVKFTYTHNRDVDIFITVNGSDPVPVIGESVSLAGLTWNAGDTVPFMYDGESWISFGENKGYNASATGWCSHAEGSASANSSYAHAEGSGTTASANAAHSEGTNTEATGNSAHAEGFITVSSGEYSHAEGRGCEATGECSHAEGYYTYATANYSHTSGYYTESGTVGETVIGQRNVVSETSGSATSTVGNAFVIGNGTGSSKLSNAFRVTKTGEVYALSEFNSSGADYAEYVKEWYDGNPDEEDRVGYFVTVIGGLLYKANPGDFIVGITSGAPSIIGNSDEDYLHRYERDEFNRVIFEDVAETIEEENENGEIVEVETGNVIANGRMKLAEDYDASLQPLYVQRANRPEWDAVGMVGVIAVRDDGTCEVDGLCKCGEGGIATKAVTREFDTFRVIERVTDSVIRVLMK